MSTFLVASGSERFHQLASGSERELRKKKREGREASRHESGKVDIHIELPLVLHIVRVRLFEQVTRVTFYLI